MKKLLLILIILPFITYSQQKSNYDSWYDDPIVQPRIVILDNCPTLVSVDGRVVLRFDGCTDYFSAENGGVYFHKLQNSIEIQKELKRITEFRMILIALIFILTIIILSKNFKI